MERVVEQFPGWTSEIKQLFRESADFQEMCQDYEEVCGLVENGAASVDHHPTAIEGYRSLLTALEDEIREALLDRFRQSDASEHDLGYSRNISTHC